MKINGENLARYRTTQLTVAFGPPQDGAGYEWPDNMLARSVTRRRRNVALAR